MPPAITANTMLSETPRPAIVSGPIYIWYCAVDRAADRAHRGRDRGDLQLLARDVDADRGGRVLVLARGIERVAVHAAVDAPPDVKADRPQRERDVIGEHAVRLELHRVERDAVAVARRLRAERAAGVVAQADDAQPHELGERQRQQREIVPDDAQVEARIADQQRDHDRHHDRDRNADPRRDAGVVPQQHHHVGADAGERAVAERGQPEAAHQRPAGVDERPDQDLDQQMQIVFLRRREHEAHRERQQQQRSATPISAVREMRDFTTCPRTGPAAG